MSALVKLEVVPFLVREQIAIHPVTMIRVASLWQIAFKVLLVLFSILLLDSFTLCEHLASLAGSKADEHALECNDAR